MRRSIVFLPLAIVALLLTLSSVHGAECTIPNTFSAGTPAVAGDVNANFDSVKTAVDDNDSRIGALEVTLAALQATVASQASTISSLESTVAAQDATIVSMQNQASLLESDNATLSARLAAVESNTVLELDGVVTKDTDISGYARVLFEGVNVQIVDGSGATDGAVNGTGNLIVGYNELQGESNDRSGSHNIVVGQYNNYTSFGGFVAGFKNEISGDFASVSGGAANTASGDYSSVSGGGGNTASGDFASVSGGNNNIASGDSSSVLGGLHNEAIANLVTVLGWQYIAGTQTAFGIYP